MTAARWAFAALLDLALAFVAWPLLVLAVANRLSPAGESRVVAGAATALVLAVLAGYFPAALLWRGRTVGMWAAGLPPSPLRRRR